MKKLFCMAAVLAVCLVSVSAWAADKTVTVKENAMKTDIAIKNVLGAAAAGDIITIEGSLKDATNQMQLTIPDGVTVKWAAELVPAVGISAVYIHSKSAGVFELVDGGSISITANKPGIFGITCGSSNATIKIIGGTVSAAGTGAIAVTTERGKLEVYGGTVTATGNGSYALYAEDDATVTGGTVTADGKECHAIFCRSAITVSGGAIKATGEGSYALHAVAGGNITVSGGEVTGKVFTIGGKVVHTGGRLNADAK